jgi:hypothetical protein
MKPLSSIVIDALIFRLGLGLNENVLSEQRIYARINDESCQVQTNVVVRLTGENAQGLGLIATVDLPGLMDMLMPLPVSVFHRHEKVIERHGR